MNQLTTRPTDVDELLDADVDTLRRALMERVDPRLVVQFEALVYAGAIDDQTIGVSA